MILSMVYKNLIVLEVGSFGLLGLIEKKLSETWLMSVDNLLSNLPLKFYSDEMTETKKIFYLERKFQELDDFIENIPEVA